AAGLVDPVPGCHRLVDPADHQVGAVDERGDVGHPADPAVDRVDPDGAVPGPGPCRGARHLGLSHVGLDVQELAGQVLQLDPVGVEQGDPADPAAGQAQQHAGAEPADPEQDDVRVAQAFLEGVPAAVEGGEGAEEAEPAGVPDQFLLGQVGCRVGVVEQTGLGQLGD